jgi:hypothetical protein
MSMPQALIAQAQPRIVQAKVRQVIEHEISKCVFRTNPATDSA